MLDGHHDAGNPTDPVGSALGKLVRALPEPVAAQAEAVRRTTALAPDRAAARPDPGTTAALVQACSNHRQVRLSDRSEAGSDLRHEVDPWAVVVRHGRWYLLCWSDTVGARRAYRIDRVRGVEELDDTISPPADLDPVALLDAETTRLVGSTSNPWWYAEQLAKIPASYRIVSCPELKEAARLLGQRLLAASESGFTPQRGTAPRPGREC